MTLVRVGVAFVGAGYWRRRLAFNLVKLIAASMLIILLALWFRKGAAVLSLAPGDSPTSKTIASDIVPALEAIYRQRAQAVLKGDCQAVRPLFATDSVYGKWALEHQERRIKYLQAWSQKRGIKLTRYDVMLHVRNIEVKGETAWVFLLQTACLGYIYNDEPSTKEKKFGIGTRHLVELVHRGGKWLVRRDWYTDPLEEDTLIPDVTPAVGRYNLPAPTGANPYPGCTLLVQIAGARAASTKSRAPAAAGQLGYNRLQAVAYADKYCGAAWGSQNDYRYNSKYRDYTALGGDCTNFVSQVLGDKEAGGLPMDGTWCYNFSSRSPGGSRAWVQTDALADYLIYSGRATLVARGTYPEVMRRIATLELGDLIAYQEKGRIVHFAVVTGRDERGYVLVNSHTADRYHVPWDIGWDKKTIFWLFHINA